MVVNVNATRPRAGFMKGKLCAATADQMTMASGSVEYVETSCTTTAGLTHEKAVTSYVPGIGSLRGYRAKCIRANRISSRQPMSPSFDGVGLRGEPMDDEPTFVRVVYPEPVANTPYKCPDCGGGLNKESVPSTSLMARYGYVCLSCGGIFRMKKQAQTARGCGVYGGWIAGEERCRT